MTKEEAYPGSNNRQAPDLTLVMRDHSFISILNKTPILYRRPEIEGTHYPKGIFLANGPGIQKGKLIDELSILDVAPCVLYSLGLDIPENFDGRTPLQIFEQSYTQTHPCKIGEKTTPVDFGTEGAGKVEEDEEENKKIFEQLRALGYVE